jgi:hypothetical protein
VPVPYRRRRNGAPRLTLLDGAADANLGLRLVVTRIGRIAQQVNQRLFQQVWITGNDEICWCDVGFERDSLLA